MRFVDRSQVPTPSDLNGSASIGAVETQRAITAFSSRRRNNKFKFRAYKRKTVKLALNALFYGKCAYCESTYEHLHPMEIEHYRPKGGVVINGRLNRPGYYWLAATWDNLLPTCIDCNRPNTQYVQGTTTTALIGKGNHFPIADELKRATSPGQEVNEEPLLLNPCLHNPEDHLEFTEQGHVRAATLRDGSKSKLGETSIRIYGLHRRPLAEERRKVALKITAVMCKIEDVAQEMDKDWVKRSPEALSYMDRNLQQLLGELKNFMNIEQPYSVMASQLIKAFIARFE